ncbi:alpha/beta fold hydrolase [Burkholderia gladioli]|uniref:Alpha/beta fold hydrolase n=1 Tax=Burkholderia gladioli TaxID=28095 RepID=A0AB38TZZ5_BURGA|nr:alpha/beta fold hydrolase [Burkholderia gladioli]MDN7813389.1 alpha/beta fold hydrolase [Burkholderia gladioli]UWX73285.1 alpha/beta fold hydrolase [Burkholderia gladioli]
MKSILLGCAAMTVCALGHAQTPTPAGAADAAETAEAAGDYLARDFRFSDGSVLPEVRLHYTTLGRLRRDAAGHATNAVLLLHGTTGSGAQFLTKSSRDALFAPGAPLDTSKYFVIVPDGLGRGGSSKPSDGLRARFPQYGYNDVVQGQYRLVTEGLKVDHLKLVLGTSMGGMQTWLWGEQHPAMMDALMPIASQPIAMAGRNWLWRQMVVGAIEHDPGWQQGDYASSPQQWIRTMPVFAIMTQNPRQLQLAAPDREAATKLYDSIVAQYAKYDANDVLYWFRSSSDYDPAPQLGRIRAKLFAVNFQDDLINATDLGAMQRLVPEVPGGRFVEIPEGAGSYGHQTLAHPEVWGKYLVQLLDEVGTPR